MSDIKLNLKEEIIHQVFNRLDKDHNGLIDREEFKKLMIELGINKALSEDKWKELFALFDTNKDGTIDFQEFKDGVERLNI